MSQIIIYHPYSEICHKFVYQGREYHRGPESLAFELGNFEMKLLDGNKKILRPWCIDYKYEHYSISLADNYDQCVLIIETILKNQEYIEKLESKIKELTALLTLEAEQ